MSANKAVTVLRSPSPATASGCADNKSERAVQSMEPRRGVADVSAAGQQNTVTYSGVTLGGDHGNEAAQRVPYDRVLFGDEELRGADQPLGAFVDHGQRSVNVRVASRPKSSRGLSW